MVEQQCKIIQEQCKTTQEQCKITQEQHSGEKGIAFGQELGAID